MFFPHGGVVEAFEGSRRVRHLEDDVAAGRDQVRDAQSRAARGVVRVFEHMADEQHVRLAELRGQLLGCARREPSPVSTRSPRTGCRFRGRPACRAARWRRSRGDSAARSVESSLYVSPANFDSRRNAGQLRERHRDFIEMAFWLVVVDPVESRAQFRPPAAGRRS